MIACAFGCKTRPESYVVRIAETESKKWRLALNGASVGGDVSNSDFTNQLLQLHLSKNDIVIFSQKPATEARQIWSSWIWAVNYCASNKVASYLYGDPQSTQELFSIPIYNWTAPFDDPGSLTKSSFFYNGKSLGHGMEGFKKMVDSVANGKAHKILILGSLYNRDSQFGSDERPYEQLQNLLDAGLKKSGSQLISVSQLP